MAPHDARGRLEAYREKRSASRTPEPFGGGDPARPGLFVVQKHAARRTHYDFRLEYHGVLKSWAVPRGPSLDPVEKRLAVEVEDHPVEYADFQGVIPEGNYGAGAVIVWDRGLWVPVEDPEEGFAKGKLLFDLQGYKLRGRWTLFKTKGRDRNPNEWLLMKKPDAWAGASRVLAEESVLSGATVEELAAGQTVGADVAAELERLGAPRARVDAGSAGIMLAQTAPEPFSRAGWIFELKYDGFRLLAAREGGKARFVYRRGSDATAIFPEVARALSCLPFEGLVLDGEVVILDEQGRPSFQQLQKRVQLQRPSDIARAAVERPATLFAFDLLGFEGFDVRPLPLHRRKELLRRLLPRLGPVRYCDHVEEKGRELFEQVTALGLEGIMAKRGDAPYRAGRHESWLKVRVERTADLVVVGFTEAQGNRTGFGALHLAAHGPSGFTYCGRVGSGFTEAQLLECREHLELLRVPAPPCSGALPRDRGHHWVQPRVVCEVRYLEWTDEGLLRQPVFLRFRDDKAPEDCVLPGAAEVLAPPPDTVPEAPRRVVPFTNMKKVFWPKEGYTKGDLIDYYREVAPFILPYLEDRPVVLTRFPDGIDGKSFFQVDAPSFVPEWVRTERHWSDDNGKEVHLFLVDDVESLLYLANLGTIPLHVWSSRISDLQRPDWCILDLDPKEAPFAHVIQVAVAVRALCEDIELPSFVKTSGSTGLHVLLPLGRQCTFDQAKLLGELLARVVAAEQSPIATIIRNPKARGGRVYVDFLQNGHGKLLVSPLCVRPRAAAPVSTPLSWDEVKDGLDIAALNIRTVPPRLQAQAVDPMRPVLDEAPDLARVLDRLLARQRSPRGRSR